MNTVERPDILDHASQLFRDGKLQEAKAIYTRIVRSTPCHPRALHALGVIAFCSGNTRKAVEMIRKAVEINPDYADAYNNLGNIYRDLGHIAEAIDCYESALTVNPDLALVQCNLGKMHRIRASIDAALLCFNRALEIDPRNADGYCGLASVYVFQGKVDEAVAAYRKAIELKPDYTSAHSNLLLILNYLPARKPDLIYRESMLWNSMHARSNAAETRMHVNKKTTGRRLRIGYVSPDFREHSVSSFIGPLLAAHDKSKFEIFCYADLVDPDTTTRSIRKLADTWRPVASTKNADFIELVRNDGIDILVDLAGHTAGGKRLLAFAEKPAPVQVTWLGYPNTTGVSAIDYRLTDYIADPEGSADRLFSERLFRLPDSFLCYAPPTDAPRVALPPSSINGYMTFGSFNNFAKIRPEVLELWSKLLNLIPDARLLLKNASFADPGTCRSCAGMFEQRGIAPDRITLLPSTPKRREHLSLYGEIDVSLDPFPYNGTTTTCESLWMGVPVIALQGDRHAGRVSASILHNAGLENFIAKTPDEYLDIALNMAKDLRHLRYLRRSLRKRMAASPVCDAVRFARNVEEAYRSMWQTWCDGTGTSQGTRRK